MIEFFDRQEEALGHLKITSPVTQLLYGGAAGGSKSFLGCAWQIERRLKYEGTRGLMGRSKLDTLKKTTLNTFFEVAFMYGLKADRDYKFNGQSNIITFYNGSEIYLKDLFAYPADPNFDSLGSLEITDYFIDEVSQVTPKGLAIVQSRVRYKLIKYDLRPKGILTCNPAKGFLYNTFYKPWRDGELPEHLAFTPALPGDNPHLPASYWETLSRLPEEDRKRLRDGDWDYDESNDRIFSYEDLLSCFRNDDLSGEQYITADIARMGKDRTVIGRWHGLTLLDIIILRRQKVDEVSRAIKELINQHKVKLSNVIADEDGVGGGVVDNLKCRGFVNGSRPKKSDRFVNLKAECYFKLAEYVENNKIVLPVAHRDDIIKEMDVIRRKNPDGDGKLSVTSKKEIADLHGFSPDICDMIMMRMEFELNPNRGVYQIR